MDKVIQYYLDCAVEQEKLNDRANIFQKCKNYTVDCIQMCNEISVKPKIKT